MAEVIMDTGNPGQRQLVLNTTSLLQAKQGFLSAEIIIHDPP
jgi:hypothetical protein